MFFNIMILLSQPDTAAISDARSMNTFCFALGEEFVGFFAVLCLSASFFACLSI